MTKQLAKQYIARAIRGAYICKNIESLKFDKPKKHKGL